MTRRAANTVLLGPDTKKTRPAVMGPARVCPAERHPLKCREKVSILRAQWVGVGRLEDTTGSVYVCAAPKGARVSSPEDVRASSPQGARLIRVPPGVRYSAPSATYIGEGHAER